MHKSCRTLLRDKPHLFMQLEGSKPCVLSHINAGLLYACYVRWTISLARLYACLVFCTTYGWQQSQCELPRDGEALGSNAHT